MNRQALVTGGTKGIGRAVAARLLRAGLDVLITYSSDADGAARAQAELSTAFPEQTVGLVQADITDDASIPVLRDVIADLPAPLDALVLNAGLTDRSSFEELTPEAWNRVLHANLTYPVFLIQALLPHFAEGASVVFTGSSLGIYPHSMSLPYGVTKSGVHALTKNLVKFLAPHGIRVNAIAPGFVATEWQKTKPVEIVASINSKISVNRFADPDEIADAYLTVIDNPYFNGEVLSIDGGYSYR